MRTTKILATGVFVLLFIWFLSQTDWGQIQDALTQIGLLEVTGVLGLFGLAYLSKAGRFFIRNRANLFRNFGLVTIHSLGLLIFPFRTGEIVFLRYSRKFDMTLAGSVGQLALVRILDVIFVSFIALGAAARLFWGDSNVVFLVATVLIVCAICALVFVNSHPRLLSQFLAKVPLLKKRSWQDFVTELTVGGKTLSILAAVSFVTWASAFLPWVFFLNVIANLPLLESVVAVSVVLGATLLPANPPAGVGLIHSGWVVGLKAVGFGLETAISIGIIAHALYVLSVLFWFLMYSAVDTMFRILRK